MSDIKENKNIVLDEDGTELDKDGNKKEKLLADHMSKADAMALINELAQSCSDAAAAADKVSCGVGYSEAADTFTRLITTVTGGSHVAFAKKNSWIADAAQRNTYLTTGGGAGIADKQFIIDLYKLIVGTADFRAEFAKFLGSCASEYLHTAYSAIRYDYKMREIVKSSDVTNLSSAFVEFDNLYNTVNDGKIYDSIPVSKSKYSAEENLQMVLDYMNGAIMDKSHLYQYLLDTKKTSPAGMNQLYVFDRETREFDKFGSREDSLQRAINTCADLDAKLAGGYALAGDGMFTYLDGYRKLLEKLVTVFQAAIDVIEAFKTKKDTAPYSIMHYDAYIKDVVGKHSLCSMSDPLSEGTNYREMASKMVSRYQNLAKTIAKLAPN